jgi:perosamine synthetase
MQLTSPHFDERELELLRECLASGWVTQGPLTEKFERAVAEMHGVKHALATSSCTAALHLAMLALGLGPDDEVIVPAFTWITTANCAEYVGARAVFADVDADTFNLDPALFEEAITERTCAVIPVHLFGLAADMGPIGEIAGKHGIHVVEDAACALGTTYQGRPVGGFGDLGCFSFHPRKVVTTGEGGMVTCDDDGLAERVQSFRNHGSTGTPAGEQGDARRPWTMATFDVLGFNLRLSDIQAAVGIGQMEKAPALIAERRAAAQRYNELLSHIDTLVLPTSGDSEGHSYQSYVVRLAQGGREARNAVMEELEREGIETRPGTHAVHRLGYYARKYGLDPMEFPVAAMCEDTTITLPIFPGMTESDQRFVASKISSVLSVGGAATPAAGTSQHISR